jgi:alanine-glyoxylate transaminase/(R)-3-amino-2-methylpropionate-pyruvate transaminase
MQYLYDHNGRRYLDMMAGFATTSVGHCHPRITEKLHEKVDRLVHSSTAYLNDECSAYAEELCERLPKGMDSVFFCSSGSEAAIMA